MPADTTTGSSFKDCLGKLVRLGLAAIRASQGAVLLNTNDGRALRFALVVSRSGLERHRQRFECLVGKEVPVGKGVTGLAALERKPHCAFGGESKDGFFRVQGDGAPSAIMAVPMLYGETLIGVMTAISFDRDRAFPPESLDTYCGYAEVVAGLVHCTEGMLEHECF